MTVVTRFAPSNSGNLHIGGVRTALFNYLYAKHHGGQFKLRIEDTDRTRITEDSLSSILNGLSWLNIDHDGDIVFQSRNAARHAEVAHEMVAKKSAYLDYTTIAEMDQLRADHVKHNPKAPFRYWDNPWRNATEYPENSSYVIRIKAPRDGETVINDAVQGRVAVKNHTLDDMILLRSDGTPTYMLAVVVDDHDMGVNTVIRGDDHLTNAFRQLTIYRAMEWEEPHYAHIPLIHDQSGKKYSKRSGAVAVEEFAHMGILSAAMVNYLVKLGWSHGEDEIISLPDMIKWFDCPAISRGPSRFDEKKLLFLNSHYLREMDSGQLAKMVIAGLSDNPSPRLITVINSGIDSMKARCSTVNEIINMAGFYAKRPLWNNELPDFANMREALPEKFTRENIEHAIKSVVEQSGEKIRNVMVPMRLAITGSPVSPPLYEAMELLGREEVLIRLGGNA